MPPHEVYIETHLGGGAVMRNKRPSRRNFGIEIDPEVIQMLSADNQVGSTRSRVGCELIHGDAITFLKDYRFTGKELVYCDPPYLRETRKKYYPLYCPQYTLSASSIMQREVYEESKDICHLKR